MQLINVDDYKEERSCTYKNEEYLVRDNGAVLRKPQATKEIRKHDNEWTFGNKNTDGYNFFFGTNIRVHHVVATAFCGEAPSNQHVIDHINNDKQDNRPINLRWVTKLEKILLDEFTQVMIEHLTGVDVYEFLDNINKYRYYIGSSHLSWMTNMRPEKAKKCLESLKVLEEAKPYNQISRSRAKERIYENSREKAFEKIKEKLLMYMKNKKEPVN